MERKLKGKHYERKLKEKEKEKLQIILDRGLEREMLQSKTGNRDLKGKALHAHLERVGVNRQFDSSL